MITACLLGCGADDKNDGKEAAVATTNKDVRVLQADFPAYGSFDELKESSDVILCGTLLSAQDTQMNAAGEGNPEVVLPHIIYTFKVDRVIDGEYSGEEIKVYVLGSFQNSDTIIVEDTSVLSIGGEYLLTVKLSEDGSAYPLNYSEAILPVTEGTVDVFGKKTNIDNI